MTGAEFIAWQERLALTIDQVARLLDVSRRTVTKYRSRREPVPFVVELACRWLEDHPGFARDYLTAARPDIFA